MKVATKELIVEKESSSDKRISLNLIRLLYLKEVLPWNYYQHFEDALSHNFGTPKKWHVVDTTPTDLNEINQTD